MKFLLAIFLLLPIISKADYSEESYFFTGKFYGSDGLPMRNKEILLVTGRRYYCFFVTDSNGNYKVEVPYLIPCLRGVDRNRLDDRAMEEAKYFNNDTLNFYCEQQHAAYTNLWYGYYSGNNLCKQYYWHSGPEVMSDCLTKKANIFLSKDSTYNNTQTLFRQKINDNLSKINQVCTLPEDSVHFLRQYHKSEKEYYYNLKERNDSLSKLGKELVLDDYKRYGELHPLSDSMMQIKLNLWRLEERINLLFSNFQLWNRKVETLGGNIVLCDRLLKLEYDAGRKEYKMCSDLFLDNYYVLKVREDKTIIDFYYFSN